MQKKSSLLINFCFLWICHSIDSYSVCNQSLFPSGECVVSLKALSLANFMMSLVLLENKKQVAESAFGHPR